MKKLKLILSLLITIFIATLVQADYKIRITSDIFEIQEDASETHNDTLGTDSTSLYNDTAFTDGDYNTYALANGTFYMNYTKLVDVTSLSLWQVKYNSSGGPDTVNHSIPSDCWGWNEIKITLKVNVSENSTGGVSPGNAHYCYSGTWDRIGEIQAGKAIYEEAIWWYVNGRTYNISYNTDKPAAYATLTKAAVNFSIYINDTLADENHTTYNASLYTRMNNTAPYTLNVSGIVVINGSFNNATITFSDGDRVWWYWNLTDNHSRVIESTDVRVFDIDVAYNILSIGANQVINLSTDSGEIVTMGGLTAANLTLIGSMTSVGNSNITGNLTIGDRLIFRLGGVIDNIISGWVRVTGNVNVTGHLEVAGNITASNYTAGSSAGLSLILNATDGGVNACAITVTGGLITGYSGCNSS